MDTLSREERSERMRRIKNKDSKVELHVRSLIHGMGYRYRLHVNTLPGSPDLVFPKRKKVIFIHGCFWHQHKNCRQYRQPKTNLDFWIPKLEANKKRDIINLGKLSKTGWRALVVWECELRDEHKLKKRIIGFLE